MTKAKNILIAEDSSVISDLVKLFLDKDGHSVTISESGDEALQNLLEKDYDLALLDYHLPILNGMEIVETFLTDRAPERAMPRFLAMTGDTKGFLKSGKGVEVFERVFPKPIDIETLIEQINQEPEVEAAEPDEPDQSRTSNGAPAAELGETQPLRIPELEMVFFPDHFEGEVEKATKLKIELEGPPDVLVFKKVPTKRELTALELVPGLHLSLAVDLTSKLIRGSDFVVTQAFGAEEDIKVAANIWNDLRNKIHPSISNSNEAADKLLARSYAANGVLKSGFNPEAQEVLQFNFPFWDTDKTLQTAQELVGKGLMEERPTDRYQICPACNGGRLIVRETCIDCGHSILNEQSYIHHFACAFQGPSQKFEVGEQLICPKCEKELRRFGADYDRPGLIHVCEACDQSMSEPDIKFTCLDCKADIEGEKVIPAVAMDFQVTESGRETIEYGNQETTSISGAFKLSSLPMAIIAKLNQFVAEHGENARFRLVAIGFPELRSLEREHGAGLVEQTRRLLVRNSVEQLSAETHAFGDGTDFILVGNADNENQSTDIDGAIVEAAKSLKVDLKQEIIIFTETDIF